MTRLIHTKKTCYTLDTTDGCAGILPTQIRKIHFNHNVTGKEFFGNYFLFSTLNIDYIFNSRLVIGQMIEARAKQLKCKFDKTNKRYE